MKLGMRGVSVVVASGDSGVASRWPQEGNEDGCLGPRGTVFSPDFPASCPYLTSVGATYLPAGASAAGDEEVAVATFPSGGGFSNIFPRLDYQSAAVASFLADHDPGYPSYDTSGTGAPSDDVTAGGTKLYNRGGRGYPDVAAVGDNIAVVYRGNATTSGGTSASAPIFASLLNRINEERLAAGKSTVGFVNPVLYAHPDMFRDVTVGSNPGCRTDGFQAVSGWDPVTGLGTPNYPAMLEVFMALP